MDPSYSSTSDNFLLNKEIENREAMIIQPPAPISDAPPLYSIPVSFARQIAVPPATHGFYEFLQTTLGNVNNCCLDKWLFRLPVSLEVMFLAVVAVVIHLKLFQQVILVYIVVSEDVTK